MLTIIPTQAPSRSFSMDVSSPSIVLSGVLRKTDSYAGTTSLAALAKIVPSAAAPINFTIFFYL